LLLNATPHSFQLHPFTLFAPDKEA